MAVQPDSRPSARERERNAQLLNELLKRDEHKLRRQAWRHSEVVDDIDDALQSAYLLFIERYRGVGEPLAWLYTTVKREAWSIRRGGSRRHERSFNSFQANGSEYEFDLADVLPTDAAGPAERFERDEAVCERRQALAELKPDERRALWLLGLGLSYVEIGEVTGWTHTKINRCISEGRSALRSKESH
jgi:RNA polymerase sigma factor (sigma-70 family)